MFQNIAHTYMKERERENLILWNDYRVLFNYSRDWNGLVIIAACRRGGDLVHGNCFIAVAGL